MYLVYYYFLQKPLVPGIFAFRNPKVQECQISGTQGYRNHRSPVHWVFRKPRGAQEPKNEQNYET